MSPLSLAPHSCATCQRLVLDGSPRHGPGIQDSEKKNFIHFNFTFADLVAAPKDCHFCAWLLGEEWIHRSIITDKVLAGRDIDENDPESAVILAVAEAFIRHNNLLPLPDPARKLSYWMDEQGQNQLDDLKLACFYHGLQVKFFALWNEEKGRVEYRSRGGFGVCARTGNPASRVVSTRPIEQDPLASATFEKVTTWMAECLEGKAWGKRIHARCSCPTNDFLPTRLIEISHDEDHEYLLKLVESASMPTTSYIALSYCWGSDQPLKTTHALLSSWMTDIPWDKLPATLKDAIIVCTKFSIRYLWVDAFCIVQDDPDEMAVEIAQMPRIYQNSTLTVAVARAASVNEGFLHPRTRTDTPNSAFELPFQCHRPIALGSVTLLKVTTSPEPLDTRGWTLQERLLAPRTLEFGSLQTRIFCQRNPRGFADGWSLSPGNSESRQDSLQDAQVLQVHFNAIRDQSIEAYGLGFEEAMNNWLKLVEVYTHRQLTVATDRILAISGVAERYGRAFGDEYCAGLWRSGFPRALFWTHSDKMQPRPRVWQGPSWSWTSIAGPVKFPIPSSMDKDSSSILHFDIELVNTKSPYGALLEGSGRLTVRARFNSAALIFNEGRSLLNDDLDVYAGFVLLGGSVERGDPRTMRIRISYDALDETEEERQENNAVLMELQTMCTTHKWMTRGLVCRSLSEDTFFRVGTFEYQTVQDSRQDGESLDEWYMRVDQDFNWFKLIEYGQYDIV